MDLSGHDQPSQVATNPGQSTIRVPGTPHTPFQKGGRSNLGAASKGATAGQKGKGVEPGERAPGLDTSKGDVPPTLSVESKKTMTKEELIKAIRALKLAPEQVEEKGDPVALALTDHIIANHLFVWVNVYRAMKVTTPDIDLFTEGLKMAKEYGLVKGFDHDEYELIQTHKPSKAFMVVCKSQESHTRLLLHKVWTVRTKYKSATYFLANDESWGSHVIYNIHGGGANFVADVLPKVYRYCGSAITKVDANKPRTIAFRDLAYYKVPHNANTHKGATGITWRIKFTPTASACENAWKAPHGIGFSNRGSVTMRKPPLCSHCISNSHGQNLCQWWTEGLVAGSKTRPDH
ncbi:hypothetical protein FRC00_003179 [Tulasnella sp. 408]|nr:hypothetical protein FRC00_003179 [Tulasnella sp. 408]